MTAEEHELLAASQDGLEAVKRIVEVVVSGCAFSCCGQGWRRRDGYEQTYRGWIDNLSPSSDPHGTLMIYTLGLGQVSAVIAARFDEVVDVQPVALVRSSG